MVKPMGRWTVRYIYQLVATDLAENLPHSVVVTSRYQVCMGFLDGFLTAELPMD